MRSQAEATVNVQEMVKAGAAAVRKYVDAAGAGALVTDEQCRDLAVAVLAAAGAIEIKRKP